MMKKIQKILFTSVLMTALFTSGYALAQNTGDANSYIKKADSIFLSGNLTMALYLQDNSSLKGPQSWRNTQSRKQNIG